MLAKTTAIAIIWLSIVLAPQWALVAAQTPDVDQFLTEGRLSDGVREPRRR